MHRPTNWKIFAASHRRPTVVIAEYAFRGGVVFANC
jgi:hypothetical protein